MNWTYSRSLGAGSLAALLAITAFSPAAATDEKPPTATQKPIKEQILGPWNIDVPKTLAAMIRQAEKESGGQKIEDEQKTQMAEMVDAMAGSLQLDFMAEGKVHAHRPEETEEATYKIIKADEASGVFTMSVTPPEQEDADTASCKILGDHMVMGVEDGKFEIHLKRLTAEQAKAQRAKMKKEDEFDKELGEEPESKNEEKK